MPGVATSGDACRSWTSSPGIGVGYSPEKQAWQYSLLSPAAREHAVEREVAEGVDPEKLADLLDRMGGRDQLLPGRRVDAVEAGAGDRRRAQPQVHLARARRPDHLHQALAGVAPDQAVVHDDHRLALDDVPHRIELDLDLGHPVVLRRVDEGPADVVVPDQAVLELDPGHLGEAQRHGVRAVGHAEDHLAPGGRLLAGQLAAQLPARAVDRLAEDRAVGPGEVHQLEDAPAHRPRARAGAAR